MPIKARPETLAMMTDLDKKVLMAIYRHRCLDEPLIQKHFYRDEPALPRLKAFNAHGLLDIVGYDASEFPALYLSQRGIQTLRELYQIPVYEVDEASGRKTRQIKGAASLKMPEILLDHQMHLNAFALAIEDAIGDRVPYEYQDNKFISACTYAQPDGIFILPSCDLFLEMDMAHERVDVLCDKWGHYRNYLAAKERYLGRPKRIVMLFATENLQPAGVPARRKSVLRSLSRMIFDLFGDDFDCYIGPGQDLVPIAAKLAAGEGGPSAAVLELADRWGASYSDKGAYLLRKDGPHPWKFCVEDYTTGSITALKRAIYYPSAPVGAPLLLLGPDEKSLYRDLAATKSLGASHIWLTTMQRARERPFPEPIFRIDQLGRIYHLSDLSHETFEGRYR